MEEVEQVAPKSKSFLLGMLIFSSCFLIPVVAFSLWAFSLHLNYELKLECVKQGRSYVNDLCLTTVK